MRFLKCASIAIAVSANVDSNAAIFRESFLGEINKRINGL